MYLYNKRFVCRLCSREFANNQNLKVHIEDAHGDNRGPFACPYCKKLSKNRSSLRMHLSNFHNVRSKDVLENCIEMQQAASLPPNCI
ncbi:hypothetical protein C0J52_05495 [Blattella germanica]|nr:hypothetical protein C0J52_05495 [Blattella germanica]